VRSTIALLTKSKAALAVLVSAVVMALVATTVGYAAMSKTVTLSVDGQATQVSTLGGTVEEILADEGITVGERDVVAPGLDAKVNEGTRIAVRYARPLDVSVDGKDKTYWVTATDVDGALDQLGLRFAGAELSASRGADISRDGLDLEVVTPKTITLKYAAEDARKVAVPVLTVNEALNELDLKVDEDDRVAPGRGATLDDGDRLVVTKVRTVNKRVTESIDFGTIEKADAVSSKVLKSTVVDKPTDTIVRVGTKEPEPVAPPEPTADYSSGSTVWDQLAACESGGNWAINTGNGYYGGLQFNLETWQSYGGSGYPHENSRETQIAIAEKVRDATGGYGSWPACSAELGLPQ